MIISNDLENQCRNNIDTLSRHMLIEDKFQSIHFGNKTGSFVLESKLILIYISQYQIQIHFNIQTN